MVHYSSRTFYYEGGAKNPLKGTSMKFLVCAQNAQLCVLAGSKDNREICNGIHSSSPVVAEAYQIGVTHIGK